MDRAQGQIPGVAHLIGGPRDAERIALHDSVWRSGILHVPSSPPVPVHPWFREDANVVIVNHVYERVGVSAEWLYMGALEL